jgi:hypothetical protein
MRLAEVTKEVSKHLSEVSERYDVPQRLRTVQDSALRGAEAARRHAHTAYQVALENPRTAIGGAILAAAVIGGVLWYLFRERRAPASRGRAGGRVRAGTERRRTRHRSRAASA